MMARRVYALVCGMALALLAGCADLDLLSLNFLQTSDSAGTKGDRVIAGSVEAVAQSTQTGLAELGITTFLNREDQGLRIACTTRMGVRFSLLLTRENTDRGEQTRVHLVWEDQPDEQTGTQVVAHLDAQAKK